MVALATNVLLLAAESPGPGRGDNPDEGVGSAVILGIIGLVLLVVLLAALLLRSRLGRRRTDVFRRRPYRRGRIGRIR
jgi:hypothetical protein